MQPALEANRKFLGYTFTTRYQPKLKVASQSVLRLKSRLREVFRQGRGRSLGCLIEELRPKLIGWVSYFRKSEVRVAFEELDQWIRRKLRAILWRQWKRPWTRARELERHVSERKFLGHRLLAGGALGIAPKSLDRAKDRIRELTRRNRGVAFEAMVGRLNSFLTGWVTYYRFAKCKTTLTELDGWIRHRLRCVRLKQRKRRYAIATFLVQLGLPAWRAWPLAWSGKGWWRKAGSPQAAEAMTNKWFEELGLVNLVRRYAALQTP